MIIHKKLQEKDNFAISRVIIKFKENKRRGKAQGE